MLRLTKEQLAGIQAKRSPNKFNARKKQVDGITFDSTHEAEVYQQLKIQQIAGLIHNLQCHVPLRVEINDQFAFTYECDFVFDVVAGKTTHHYEKHYQDAKGYKKGTAYQLFRLKKSVIKAALGVDIEEV